MLIDIYQTQSGRNQVSLNPLLALIVSMLLATTAAAAVDLAHNQGGYRLNNSIIPALSPFNSASPMPTNNLHSDWSGMPTNLSSKLDKPMCRREYGANLNKKSCVNAWRSIPVNTQEHTYGRRNRGRFQVPLPQRFLSGE